MFVNSKSVLSEIDETDVQHEKHDEQRMWTERGIVIDLSKEHDENTFDSMHINLESISHETDHSDSQ
jgi:hypothetical protein